MSVVQVGIIGLGYFSQFHVAAWRTLGAAKIQAVLDVDGEKARSVATELSCTAYSDLEQMLEHEHLDIIDIIAPPNSHKHLVEKSLKKNRLIICQKPFCNSMDEAQHLVKQAKNSGTALVIHENFRFQPWFRTIKNLLDNNFLGHVYQAKFNLRPGDGRGEKAYLSRQPSFQKMQRFLLHETGVHYIDVFRWLFGEVESIYADTRQLNPVIAGEDAGLLILDHTSGTQSILDANRLSDHPSDNLRRTMGTLHIDAENGTLELDGHGRLFYRSFGSEQNNQIELDAPIDENSFGGGCVTTLTKHALDAYSTEGDYENSAEEYLKVMQLVAAAYDSAERGTKLSMDTHR
ncbi:MAG: Gfo/Idh/MocA family oxidoreductase [Gammaproteobacteria bacterium]|nr:Gfo/Idh/MocA family oxidoreductase [Gammaproteobacteria bacterium]